ncbi:MAG TPA: AzlC family ABC transporter permease [Acidimicrobiales bacterium]|nr:AzlC family ABC transporter permease [Acidimicrobiales bacterium]
MLTKIHDTETTNKETTNGTEVRAAARAGVIAISPLVIGFAPFALVVGATIGASSYHHAGIASSWLVYGGSAQIATVRTLEHGGAAMAVLAALLINSRLLVYSASLSQHWRDQPLWFRVTAAPMIVDPVWAVAEARALQPGSPSEKRAHYYAAALTLGLAWSVLVVAGVVLGSRIDTHALVVAAPLCLLYLVGQRLKDHRTAVIVLAAAGGALVARGLPSGLSIFIAIIAGCVVGESLDRRRIIGELS